MEYVSFRESIVITESTYGAARTGNMRHTISQHYTKVPVNEEPPTLLVRQLYDHDIANTNIAMKDPCFLESSFSSYK